MLAEITLPAAFGRSRTVIIEGLPHVHGYAGVGLRIAELTPPSAAAAAARLAEAFEVVARVDGLALALGCLLKAIHVLEAPSPDHDVSFSDPEVPFSALVGVQGVSGPNAAVRLAEQVVHECMHLQLTLLEAVHPFTSADVELHWSPWQEKPRPARGVLHGLYVFRVLDAFFAELASGAGLDAGAANHLARRRREIAAETAAAAASLSRSSELTSFGRAFLDAILAPREACF